MLWTTHIWCWSNIAWHFGEMDKTLSNNNCKVFKGVYVIVQVNRPRLAMAELYTLWSDDSRGLLDLAIYMHPLQA